MVASGSSRSVEARGIVLPTLSSKESRHCLGTVRLGGRSTAG